MHKCQRVAQEAHAALRCRGRGCRATVTGRGSRYRGRATVAAGAAESMREALAIGRGTATGAATADGTLAARDAVYAAVIVDCAVDIERAAHKDSKAVGAQARAYGHDQIQVVRVGREVDRARNGGALRPGAKQEAAQRTRRSDLARRSLCTRRARRALLANRSWLALWTIVAARTSRTLLTNSACRAPCSGRTGGPSVPGAPFGPAAPGGPTGPTGPTVPELPGVPAGPGGPCRPGRTVVRPGKIRIVARTGVGRGSRT